MNKKTGLLQKEKTHVLPLCDHFPDFDELFSFFPIHVYSIDKYGVYRSCNEVQAQNFGLKNKKNIVGKTNLSLPKLKDHPDVIRVLNSNNNEVIQSGKPLEFIEPFFLKTGVLGQCKSFKIPIFEKNEIIGLIGISFDISDETERFNMLKAQHEQTTLTLRSVMANLPEHIYWLDKNNHFLGCNAQQASDFGLTDPSEVVGLHVSSFQTEENAAVIIENNRSIMESGISNTAEEEFVDKQGQRVFYLSKKVPLKDSENNMIGLLGISFDITHLKNMEFDLQKAKEKAETASQVKSDFISNMEHDLRTPFTGIRGIADILYDMETDKEKRDLLEIMLRSCKQWENVHNRIFDALVMEQFASFKIESFSISKILMDLQEEMEAAVRIKQLEYITEPVASDIDLIKTDQAKFRLILSCLISNAVKFTIKGRIDIKVARKGSKHIVINVIDTGIGIPAEKFEYIFEEFKKLSRSNKHASDFQGVGSGLYIARACASKLGACIGVQSDLGCGSVFSLSFPIE